MNDALSKLVAMCDDEGEGESGEIDAGPRKGPNVNPPPST